MGFLIWRRIGARTEMTAGPSLLSEPEANESRRGGRELPEREAKEASESPVGHPIFKFSFDLRMK